MVAKAIGFYTDIDGNKKSIDIGLFDTKSIQLFESVIIAENDILPTNNSVEFVKERDSNRYLIDHLAQRVVDLENELEYYKKLNNLFD